MDSREHGVVSEAGSNMTRAEFVAKWDSRRTELARLRAHVDGALLCAEMLEDFTKVTRSDDDEALNLTDAARECGYSADHLGRLVRQGTIPNVGRPNAPRVRRSDLPRKATVLRRSVPAHQIPRATPVEIARAVVTSGRGDPR